MFNLSIILFMCMDYDAEKFDIFIFVQNYQFLLQILTNFQFF